MLELKPARTGSNGVTERVVLLDGKDYAIISQDRPRAWWDIHMRYDGNAGRSRKCFPKRYRTAAAAWSALREAYLDALEGKRHPKFKGA